MTVSADYYLEKARVPETLEIQSFGQWRIERSMFPLDLSVDSLFTWSRRVGPWPFYTALFYSSPLSEDDEYINADSPRPDLEYTYVVMEDSEEELRKHMCLWMAARGSVLINGLGLGCCVRGLLANSEVTHIDVVELDEGILRVIGSEFVDNPRVTLHHADAFTIEFPADKRWDFAWHDLCDDQPRTPHIQVMHAKLLTKYRDRVKVQGAWRFPRDFAKQLPFRLLGTPSHSAATRRAALQAIRGRLEHRIKAEYQQSPDFGREQQKEF